MALPNQQQGGLPRRIVFSSASGPAARATLAALIAVASLLAVLGIYGYFGASKINLKAFKPLNEVRWGLIGCGDVTEKKSGPAFSLVPHSRLVLVMRRNGSAAEDYARRHGIPRWTTDALELIRDSEVNAIYIATPPRYHVHYANLAARHGKPVYVEKPMGMSYEESREAVKTFRAARLPLYVAYYRRYLPNFLQIKRLLDTGAIGEVRAVQVVYHRPPNKHDLAWALSREQALLNADGKTSAAATSSPSGSLPRHHPAGASLRNASLRWRTDPSVGGIGGYFRDKGSHQLDLLDLWFGPIVAASGWSTNQAGLYASPDSIVAHFRFANGIVGTGSWNFVSSKAGQQEYGEITGSLGRIKFQFFLSNKIEFWNEKGYTEFNDASLKHVQQPMIEAVVRALRGEGECVSTGESALRTSLVMDRIVKGMSFP